MLLRRLLQTAVIQRMQGRVVMLDVLKKRTMPRALMRGEVEDTNDADEIRHWHSVYSELWAGVSDAMARISGEDRSLLASRSGYVKIGYQFWTDRLRAVRSTEQAP